MPDCEHKGPMAQAQGVLRGDTHAWPARALYRDLIRHFGQPILDAVHCQGLSLFG